jgi:hypothetical protein
VFDLLRRVALEVEAERAPLGQHVDLAREVSCEVRRHGLELTKEVVDPGH